MSMIEINYNQYSRRFPTPQSKIQSPLKWTPSNRSIRLP